MKKILLFFPIFLILAGCTSKVSEEDLIGDTWKATAGYEDGEKKGGPDCYPFEEGMEFKDDDIVYIEAYERDFQYELYKDGAKIVFFDTGPNKDAKDTVSNAEFSYDIQKIDDDEITLEGRATYEGYSCYFER